MDGCKVLVRILFKVKEIIDYCTQFIYFFKFKQRFVIYMGKINNIGTYILQIIYCL